MKKKIVSFCQSEEAATTVEYAFLITLIVIALSQTIRLVGNGSRGVFEATANVLPNN